MSGETRAPGPYRTEILVPFDLCDPAGILFFGHVFPLAHRAFEGMVVAAGIAWEEWFASGDWNVPVTRASAEFTAPLPAGSTARLEVVVSETRTTSLTVETTFLREDAVCARVRTVHVFVDPGTGATRPVPEEFREALARFRRTA